MFLKIRRNIILWKIQNSLILISPAPFFTGLKTHFFILSLFLKPHHRWSENWFRLLPLSLTLFYCDPNNEEWNSSLHFCKILFLALQVSTRCIIAFQKLFQNSFILFVFYSIDLLQITIQCIKFDYNTQIWCHKQVLFFFFFNAYVIFIIQTLYPSSTVQW